MDSFAALSDASRRSIIVMLAEEGELNAGEIGARFDFTASALSKHLKILREAKLVQMEKRAQSRVYSVDPQGLQEMERWMRDVNKFWSRGLDRLEAALRAEDAKKQKSKPKKRKD